MKLVFLLALTVVASFIGNLFCFVIDIVVCVVCEGYAREVPDKFPPGVTPDTPPFSYVTPPPPPPMDAAREMSKGETKFPPGVTPDTPPFSYVTPPPPPSMDAAREMRCPMKKLSSLQVTPPPPPTMREH
ncbi:hypothetical protein YC2023_020692 [Brassica napus]